MTDDKLPPQGPLSGLRVLDLSRILAGPTCTQLLGDYGAEVIKIERPGHGDDTRQWGPTFLKDKDGNDTRESGYYLSSNRNKQSVAIDITTAEGQTTIRELAAISDIFVENFMVGGLKKYGLSYDDLKAEFPELIYLSITGFGQTGPNAHRPGYDLLAQAAFGLMSVTGAPDGEPMKVGVAITDLMTGMYATTAILAALHHKNGGGGGQHIDIALADTQTAFLINQGLTYLLTGRNPQRHGNQHPNIVPYQSFAAKDGHVIVAVGNDGQFRRFCRVLDLAPLADDPRFATNAARVDNRTKLLPHLEKAIANLDQAAFLAAMDAASVSAGPINKLHQVFEEPQLDARDMKINMDHVSNPKDGVNLLGNPVKFSETPVTYRHAPPVCGQHTAEVLARLLGREAKE